MMTEQQYVVNSLDLHLFFGRIMKEHSLFLEAGFTPKNAAFATAADKYKVEFEKLLRNAIRLSDGVVSPAVLHSGELITDYTLGSERKTQNFTGIAIDQSLTVQESRLHSGMNPNVSPSLVQAVRELNAGAMPLINSLIDFKTQVLDGMLSCNMFTMNYPLLIDHIRREAKAYRDHLMALEQGQDMDNNMRDMELFWDQIMMEHALFIRGLLDPSEGDLINMANDFAAEYNDLIKEAQAANDAMFDSVTQETLEDTMKYRDFKAAATEGIAACKIRSIILPLLADHVLREANHYIRLLEHSKGTMTVRG